MTDEFTEERGYEPRELQNPAIIEAFAAGVMAFGHEAVRKKLRKGKTSLYGEMNPNGDQKKAKLSVDDAIEATRVTRNFIWLSMVAEELGHSLIPNDAAPDKATVAEELNDVMKELGILVEVCANPNTTVKELRHACAALRRESREAEALKVKEIKARSALRGRKA